MKLYRPTFAPSIDKRVAVDANPRMSVPTLDLDSFLPYQLSVTANAVSDVIARAYRSLFGLRVPEWRLIAILAQSPGLTPQAISARAALDKITVSRAAKALLGRELIAAQGNPEDGRSHRLALTETGIALYRTVVPTALALEAQMLSALSPAEVRTLEGLLRRVRAALPANGDPAAAVTTAATQRRPRPAPGRARSTESGRS